MYRKLYHNKTVTGHMPDDWVQIEAGTDVLLFSIIYMYAHPTSYPVGGRGDPSLSKYECNLP